MTRQFSTLLLMLALICQSLAFVAMACEEEHVIASGDSQMSVMHHDMGTDSTSTQHPCCNDDEQCPQELCGSHSGVMTYQWRAVPLSASTRIEAGITEPPLSPARSLFRPPIFA
ncbi:hypothetical protein HMF8227_01839 [Saliniradius amylolyticus]|uniref:Uncharacterized protein n=1 Tax=Saliniradius amylolyticus TaxID=2183582 RepID=A0A2S2E475_9ALTE|nr:hypothetical protein [Saliniradius amylolyticus]AWL12312.1 hypothetical protein HMF8227_01839 [Saliniradius amylolyticus]